MMHKSIAISTILFAIILINCIVIINGTRDSSKRKSQRNRQQQQQEQQESVVQQTNNNNGALIAESDGVLSQNSVGKSKAERNRDDRENQRERERDRERNDRNEEKKSEEDEDDDETTIMTPYRGPNPTAAGHKRKISRMKRYRTDQIRRRSNRIASETNKNIDDDGIKVKRAVGKKVGNRRKELQPGAGAAHQPQNNRGGGETGAVAARNRKSIDRNRRHINHHNKNNQNIDSEHQAGKTIETSGHGQR